MDNFRAYNNVKKAGQVIRPFTHQPVPAFREVMHDRTGAGIKKGRVRYRSQYPIKLMNIIKTYALKTGRDGINFRCGNWSGNNSPSDKAGCYFLDKLIKGVLKMSKNEVL